MRVAAAEVVGLGAWEGAQRERRARAVEHRDSTCPAATCCRELPLTPPEPKHSIEI